MLAVISVSYINVPNNFFPRLVFHVIHWPLFLTDWKLFLPLSPDPQVVLWGLHEIRDIAAISTEFCHEWRVLGISIPHLNKIWCETSFTAIYVKGEEGEVDICTIRLSDEVDTVGQFGVVVGVWGWGQDSTRAWVGATTIIEQFRPFLAKKSFCFFAIVVIHTPSIQVFNTVFIPIVVIGLSWAPKSIYIVKRPLLTWFPCGKIHAIRILEANPIRFKAPSTDFPRHITGLDNVVDSKTKNKFYLRQDVLIDIKVCFF